MINTLVSMLCLLFSAQSLAEPLEPAAKHCASCKILALNSVQNSDSSMDTLSDSAASELKLIDEEDANSVAAANTTELVQAPKADYSNGSLNAYAQLTQLAFKGKGTNGVRNYADAAKQYCHAARDINDANAEFALGWLYVNGKGVEKDENLAALFFTKAAEQGHTSAKNWLTDIKGNPSLAVLPNCMLPDPPNQLVQNPAIGTPEANSEPFYTKGPIYKLVSRIAPRFNIDTDLAMAFIAVESGFNPKATSPKNARGLMQLIPETAARFNVKDSYDPEENIKGGLAYLRWLMNYFEGDVKLVAAAYNSGENTVDKYKGVPPYPETKKYVQKIASLYKKPFHPYGDDLGANKKSKLVKVSGYL